MMQEKGTPYLLGQFLHLDEFDGSTGIFGIVQISSRLGSSLQPFRIKSSDIGLAAGRRSFGRHGRREGLVLVLLVAASKHCSSQTKGTRKMKFRSVGTLLDNTTQKYRK
jgi:hypothetical protein